MKILMANSNVIFGGPPGHGLTAHKGTAFRELRDNVGEVGWYKSGTETGLRAPNISPRHSFPRKGSGAFILR